MKSGPAGHTESMSGKYSSCLILIILERSMLMSLEMPWKHLESVCQMNRLSSSCRMWISESRCPKSCSQFLVPGPGMEPSAFKNSAVLSSLT